MDKRYNLKLDLQFRCNNSIMKFNHIWFFMRITNGGNLVDIEKAIYCSNNINLDEVLDKINIYPTQTTYETDLATCKTNSERSLEIGVT